MTVRKMLTGLVAVALVLTVAADAQAFGKRKKKNRGGCDDCAAAAAPVHTAAPGCGGCGTAWAGGPQGYAVAAPEAMPAVGVVTQPGAVVPVTGTTGGAVVPATGVVVPQSGVIPAGGNYLPDGGYVVPAGNTTFDGGFRSGVVQGALGTPAYYPYGSTVQGAYGNNLGRQVGRGIFRR